MTQPNSHTRILVTGGCGFIGTHLTRELVTAGLKVTVLDCRAPKQPVAGARYLRGDIRDQTLLAAAVGESDAVYHLAAIVSVPLCDQKPIESFSVNFTGTLHLLEALRQENLRRKEPIRLIFASSASVYGDLGNSGTPLSEDTVLPTPSSAYALQKLFCEVAIRQYSLRFGIPGISLRFFNVYGRGQDPRSSYSGVITIFTERLRRDQPLIMNGGGTQTRDFIWVEDLTRAARAVLALEAQHWNGQSLNLGSGTIITIRGLAMLLGFAFGKTPTLVDAPAREGDVMHSLANIDRLCQLTGWQPEIALDEGLATFQGPAEDRVA